MFRENLSVPLSRLLGLALAILVIPCASCLMIYIECGVFHFHGMYLNGKYGNKIK